MTKEELIAKAIEAREKSYSPYSHFQVGAALETTDGVVYTGCNIENSAYGPSNCAERTAFFKAISEGERKFSQIAVVGGKEGEDISQFCPPCGVCRQVMSEFCDPETFLIYLSDGEFIRTYRLEEIMPLAFGL